jgi:hypothetical protein
MKNNKLAVCALIFTLLMSACNREEFLNVKPASNILTPKSMKDFQALLDNNILMNSSGIALGQLSADDHVLTYSAWQSLKAIPRNSYIWAPDIYQGEKGTNEWDKVYTQIFYANNVLDGLAKSDSVNSETGKYLKGWALFVRSYGFFDLIRNYCKAYDAATAGTDLGIPLRLKSGIDYIAQRASLQESYNQVISDLEIAESLLPSARPSANLNRPSKIAVYALLARIYLDRREYGRAEINADKCLELYNALIDYNTLSKTDAFPFSNTNSELIYNSLQASDYAEVVGSIAALSVASVNPELLDLYHPDDLRKSIFFARQADGSYKIRPGYYGTQNLYPFMGLATDELYLIKAECLARRDQVQASMDVLNQLLVKRFDKTQSYVPLTSTSTPDAVNKVLLERRKELVWRGMRWHDLKRLNQEGANISLSRLLNGVIYNLPANDNRWVFPIYPDEVALSGLVQNIR